MLSLSGSNPFSQFTPSAEVRIIDPRKSPPPTINLFKPYVAALRVILLEVTN